MSHSLDDASGLQTSGNFGTALILNPIRQEDNYASSDFDVRHIVNVNGVWQQDDPSTPQVEVNDWGRVTNVTNPRFARFSLTFDF